MLHELRVENLLLIERAQLRLAPGLNVLTGETGAGKTVLAHALDLLLGGRARPGIVRPGAAEAWVEGVFDLPDEVPDAVRERLPEDAQELVLARRVGADGRTRAYLGGRAASAADLQEVGGRLLTFYGQHEHRRLALASAQLEILDRFCGPGQAERRSAMAGALRSQRALEAEVAELRDREGSRERELDLLRWELAEIEEDAPRAGEDEELSAERSRLRHLEGLRGAAAVGSEALAGREGEDGASVLLAHAERALEAQEGVDPALDALAERLRALRLEAEDLAAELRAYGEAVEGGPGRLEEVEERLEALERLKRKHGGTLAAVLAHAEECRARREAFEGAEGALAELEGRLESARAEVGRRAAALSRARRAAAGPLAEAVQARPADLAVPGARLEVPLPERPEPGPAGSEAVELLVAANAGVPPGPLKDVASGGELSRVMLALMGVAAEGGSEGDGRPGELLVFDEVDAGIGGHTARAVGEQLRRLAAARQVLCITHLPQVASLAERHFTIAKDAESEPARATVCQLDGDGVVAELVRMLGAAEGDTAATRHAEELLAAA